MPSAIWPTPAADEPAFDPSVYKTKEVRGLGDFLGGSQPDFGVELSDRLGVLAEIFGRLGKGSGMQGISETISNVNERSSARSERRKMTTMANRFADKIADRDPDLAAMIYANPKFGMELLGKKYEADWASKNEMERSKLMLPFELEKAKKLAQINNDAEKAMKIELLTEEYRLDKISGEETLQRLFGIQKAPSTGGSGTAVTPTVTPPPAPDAGAAPVSALQVDPNTGTPSPGQGTEPAPTQPVVQDTAQPVPEPVPTVTPVPDNAIVWSKDEYGRAIQKSFKEKGANVSPVMADAIVAAARRGKKGAEELGQLLRTVEAQAIEERHRGEDQQNVLRAEARKLTEPLVREQMWREDNVTPIQGPDSPLDQSMDLDQRAVLRGAGFSDEDIAVMPDPEAQAQSLLAGAQQGPEGVRTATTATRGELGKAREDLATKQMEDTQRAATASSVDKILATLPSEDTPEGQSAAVQQSRGELMTIKNTADPKLAADALNKWRTLNQSITEAADKGGREEREVRIKEAKQRLEEEAQKEKTTAEKDKQLEANKMLRQQSLNAVTQIERGIDILSTSPEYTRTGALGAGMSLIPGTARNQLQGVINTIKSIAGLQSLAGIRRTSPTGAGLSGISDTDIKLLQQEVMDTETAMATGEGSEYAFKKMYNHFMNIYDPIGIARKGGMRFDEESAGLALRPFDLRRDNSVEYDYLVEKYGTEDVESVIYKKKAADEDQTRTDRAGGADPLGLF